MTLNDQKGQLARLSEKKTSDSKGKGFQLTIKLANSLEKIGSILEHRRDISGHLRASILMQKPEMT